MPTPLEWVAYFYPYLVDSADPRVVSPPDLDMALAVAADWRPACLTADRQNQAQAHYAAYVAAFRQQIALAGLSVSVTEVTAGPIIERTEGDTTIRYATSGGTTATTSSIRANLTGPNTPYAAWEALWAICAGSTVLEPGQLPVRKGAIMTSAG